MELNRKEFVIYTMLIQQRAIIFEAAIVGGTVS